MSYRYFIHWHSKPLVCCCWRCCPLNCFNMYAFHISISSQYVSICSLSGPFVSALANKFGFRMVTIMGAITSSLGFLVSAYATSVEFLIVSYGLIGGEYWVLLSNWHQAKHTYMLARIFHYNMSLYIHIYTRPFRLSSWDYLVMYIRQCISLLCDRLSILVALSCIITRYLCCVCKTENYMASNWSGMQLLISISQQSPCDLFKKTIFIHISSYDD